MGNLLPSAHLPIPENNRPSHWCHLRIPPTDSSRRLRRNSVIGRLHFLPTENSLLFCDRAGRDWWRICTSYLRQEARSRGSRLTTASWPAYSPGRQTAARLFSALPEEG